jgi:hypothetical protein
MAFITNSAIQTRTAQQAPACERHSEPTCSGARQTERTIGMAKTDKAAYRCPVNRGFNRCCKVECFGCRWSYLCQREIHTNIIKAVILRKTAQAGA